jgi:hypothetical protein
MRTKKSITDLILSELVLKDGVIYRASTGKAACVIKGADGHLFTVCKKRTVYVHRAVWILTYGAIPDGIEIDHVNGNPEDNRIGNLRPCTRSQNCQNMKIRKDSTSGVKGVFYDKANDMWRGCVSFNKQRHYVGRFKTLEDAQAAVVNARALLHGEFCNHGLHQRGAV